MYEIKEKENMQKIMKIGMVLIVPIVIIGVFLILNDTKTQAEKGTPLSFTRKNTFDRKEDDWIYTFEINYPNTNEKNNYIFDGYNLKYKESEEHYIPVYDENGNEAYRVKPECLSLSNSEKYKDDILSINLYFNEKQFEEKITEDDLQDLDINYIDKEYLLDIFNRTVESKVKTLAGEYYNSSFIGRVSQESTDKNLPGEWQATYILDFGNIYDINIQFIDKSGNYLSEKDNQNMNSKEKGILNQIESVKKESLNLQKITTKNTNKDVQTLLEKLQNKLTEY